MDGLAHWEAHNRAMTGLEDMLFEIGNPMAQFKRSSYPAAFQEYYRKCEPVMEAIEEAYQMDEDPQGCCRKLAERLADLAQSSLDGAKKKSKREERLLNFNMLLATYLFPAILEYHGESAEPVTDAMIQVWNERFKVSLGKASHEKIQEGFQRKLCYITTAVCQSLGKGDDCYELELLRHYRDDYLLSTEEGRALVEEYYDIAPTIVTRINREEEAARIYQEIWDAYLKPCIRYMEQQEWEAGQRCYRDMALDLKGRYIV